MAFREIAWQSADGLALYGRDYGPPKGPLTPLLCLPGLTRNSKDFHDLATRLGPWRRVVCPDFRGRGKSAHAGDASTYRPEIELGDTLLMLDALGIGRCAVIGTSRGGIVAMVMAARARERLAGVLLNDIGPRIEREGLIRILKYVGGNPTFESWSDAVASLKATNFGFDGLSEAEWMAYARRVFREVGGKPRADFDARLARNFPPLADIEAGKVLELWDLFKLMGGMPLAVLRGTNSDLLSEATVSDMQRLVPGLEAVTVRNRGHVPFLDEPESVAAIDSWLWRVDHSKP